MFEPEAQSGSLKQTFLTQLLALSHQPPPTRVGFSTSPFNEHGRKELLHTELVLGEGLRQCGTVRPTPHSWYSWTLHDKHAHASSMIAKYDEKAQPTSWSERGKLRQAEEMAAQEVPKPYTVPEGYKAPTMSEQWLYATRRHPYYRQALTRAVSRPDNLLCSGKAGMLAFY